MIILDTHAWLWWLDGDRRLTSRAGRAIDASERIGVCAVSCFEVSWLTTHRRIAMTIPLADWMERAFADPRAALVPLTVEVSIRAAQLGPAFVGDPMDRIITASAMVLGCPLVTADQKIQDAGLVEIIW